MAIHFFWLTKVVCNQKIVPEKIIKWAKTEAFVNQSAIVF